TRAPLAARASASQDFAMPRGGIATPPPHGDSLAIDACERNQAAMDHGRRRKRWPAPLLPPAAAHCP
ncbi:hypothetical protein MMZ06_18105, partial [Burkholderia gladioli]|uniref:hypothetical protein n=1 Tax=Burkholderia gladioli TaxID=28095 RepID=UPI001F4AF7AA